MSWRNGLRLPILRCPFGHGALPWPLLRGRQRPRRLPLTRVSPFFFSSSSVAYIRHIIYTMKRKFGTSELLASDRLTEQSLATTRSGGEPSPLNSPDLNLLSLDGGGVRGLSTLYILKRIIDQLNLERKKSGLEAVKPCEIFDLIGGTSTGG